MARDHGAGAPPAFDLVEEAVALLKQVPPMAWAVWAAGTLGFLWALLSFVAYMGRNALAPAHLAERAFLLVLAYAGMKACHAAFFTGLMERLLGEAGRSRDTSTLPGLRTACRYAATQALIQPLGLLVVPIAILAAIPFPWAIAFFQNAQWVPAQGGLREWLGRSWRMTLLWPLQNFQLHLFLFAAALCVLANYAVALGMVPYLLKSLFALDTAFTRSWHALFNTTSFMVIAALTWATLDPLVKALYALRCFRGESLHTGLDLRLGMARAGSAPSAVELSRLRGAKRTAIMVLAAVLLSTGASATPAPTPALANPTEIEALLEAEIGDSRYSWRLPEKVNPVAGERSLVVRWLDKAFDRVRGWVEWTSDAVRRFLDWLDGLFGKKDMPEAEEGKGFSFSSIPPKAILAVLFLLVILAIAAGIWKRRPSTPTVVAKAMAAPEPRRPDIASEDVRPDDLPEVEWLRLMERLRKEGRHRLALRALFLAQLAVSARKGWLVVARAKSNRDYQREVALKSRRDPGVADSFREGCLRFERAWYGHHEVTEEDWEVCLAAYGRLDGHG